MTQLHAGAEVVVASPPVVEVSHNRLTPPGGANLKQLQTPTNNRSVCQICGRIGHSALKCWNHFNAYQSDDAPQALAALHVSNPSGREWLPDSGSTAHITASASDLQQSTPYHGSETVMVGNGNQVPITHVGSTIITTPQGSIPLLDVLVCPSI